MKPYKEHPLRSERIDSAKRLIRYILECPREGVAIAHINQLLNVLIWKITEADGKSNLRFWSEGCMSAKDRKKLIHEHVFERSQLIRELIQTPDQMDLILENAIACTVTKDEHERLAKVDMNLQGWQRYHVANISVWDRKDNCWLISSRA